jgi:hypothetical protein
MCDVEEMIACCYHFDLVANMILEQVVCFGGLRGCQNFLEGGGISVGYTSLA